MCDSCPKQRSTLTNGWVIPVQRHDPGQRGIVAEPTPQTLAMLRPRSDPWLSSILDDLVTEPVELLEGERRFVIQGDDSTTNAQWAIVAEHRKPSQRFKIGLSGYPGQHGVLGFRG